MSSESCRSGNSKRSSNSRSSNPNKTQKTLSAAWGANSPSSSRSSFRASPFSDFGSYMAVKNKKLHDQFDAEASSSYDGSDTTKPIFQGVSIFVDGFTVPSSQELRTYMVKHGGRFENYFSRKVVTHIICSNLPDSKIRNLRSFSRGLPVVKPAWVVDCVAASKLLSWVPYQLDQLANEARSQPKLSDFFALRSSKVSGAVSSNSHLSKVKAEDSQSKDAVVNDNTALGEFSEDTRQSDREKDVAFMDMTTADVEEQISRCKEVFQSEFRTSATDTNKSSLLSSSLSGSKHDLLRPAAEESSGSAAGGSSYNRHSTSEDPNFVENYFQSSRLHFIGTWRNRYRKRFSCLSSKGGPTDTDASPPAASKEATIIHIDMDCFFVAVVIRNRPELLDKPVAVCHSDSARGTAEISSANYPARDYGVKAGMFVRDAKARCPHLLIVPYNFEAYEEVADQFYNILHTHCNKVQAVSCDEAFLDVTDSDETDPVRLASVIRKDILETTGCTASAGVAGNLLMARLATRTAKPDGQCYIPAEKVDECLVQLPIKALPGIGRVLEDKLKKKGVQTCSQLRVFSKESLQRDFGLKTGEMLWNHCRGVDNRVVGAIQESKSVGADVNWGVRFKDSKDSQHFLLSLCKEVSLRLQGCGVQGRTFTLKIKKRRKNAEEPTKYMGCGDCENLSHSTTVPVASDDVDVLQRITMRLFGLFHIDVKEIRGIGLQVTKLEGTDISNQGHEKNTMRSWLTSGGGSANEQCILHDTGQSYIEPSPSSARISDQPHHEASSNLGATIPSLNDLDMGVIESLPPELFSEINDIYGGKLIHLISQKRGKVIGQNMCGTSSMTNAEGKMLNKLEARACVEEDVAGIKPEDEVEFSRDQEEQDVPTFRGYAGTSVSCALESENTDLMPTSLSQVDATVLQELPEELRADIVGALPAHRKSNCIKDCSINSTEEVEARVTDDHTEFTEGAEGKTLWVGNPPYWIHKFKLSSCLILNILAETYMATRAAGLLSSALQCCLSSFQTFSDSKGEYDSEASDSLYELLKQYIQLKVAMDIEEIYVCFRLLKRLTLKSKAFLHAYEAVLPHLQLWGKLASTLPGLGDASHDSVEIWAVMLICAQFSMSVIDFFVQRCVVNTNNVNRQLGYIQASVEGLRPLKEEKGYFPRQFSVLRSILNRAHAGPSHRGAGH